MQTQFILYACIWMVVIVLAFSPSTHTRNFYINIMNTWMKSKSKANLSTEMLSKCLCSFESERERERIHSFAISLHFSLFPFFFFDSSFYFHVAFHDQAHRRQTWTFFYSVKGKKNISQFMRNLSNLSTVNFDSFKTTHSAYCV